jgi:very-short-patch-repair endonuclease
MRNYNEMSDSEKYSLLNKYYNEESKSFKDIADMFNTYANKVRRDAKKLGIKIRSKSEAQKNALQTGKHKHPTKGTIRSEETKEKIGLSVMDSWENMSKSELKRRKELAKLNWEKMPEEVKQNMLQNAHLAVRETSKVGSKLERYLLENLINNNIKVQPHKEQMLNNTKLHIDLFLPKDNIAIEVDGPSHFEPVWGEEALKRNQDYDSKKNGLLIGKGISLIRIKQTKDFSKSRASVVFGKLMEAIKDIKDQGKNYIEIGDNE